MSKKIAPPNCFICSKNFEGKADMLLYCICDTAICVECSSSVKEKGNLWKCPQCSNSNDIEASKLIRPI